MKQKFTWTAIGVLVLEIIALLAFATKPAHAALMQYANMSAWLAAVAPNPVDNVDFDVGNPSGGYSYVSGFSRGNITLPQSNVLFTTDYYTTGHAVTKRFDDTLIINFDLPVIAFGFDAVVYLSTPLQGVLSTADTFVTSGGMQSFFFGIVSAAPFDSITLSEATPDDYVWNLTNVYSAAAVPAPGTLALLGLGLFGLGYQQRKRAA
jgi:hypothetical protein